FAVNQLLIAAQKADVAEKNDVAFDACDDAVDNILSPDRAAARDKNRGEKHKSSHWRSSAHQNEDPRLKKIWNRGNCVPLKQEGVGFGTALEHGTTKNGRFS